MNGVILELNIDLVLDNSERQELLITPLDELLRPDIGHMVFKVPSFRRVNGELVFDPVSLDLVLFDFVRGVSAIKNFLRDKELLHKSCLRFRSPKYNLLDLG